MNIEKIFFLLVSQEKFHKDNVLLAKVNGGKIWEKMRNYGDGIIFPLRAVNHNNFTEDDFFATDLEKWNGMKKSCACNFFVEDDDVAFRFF